MIVVKLKTHTADRIELAILPNENLQDAVYRALKYTEIEQDKIQEVFIAVVS